MLVYLSRGNRRGSSPVLGLTVTNINGYFVSDNAAEIEASMGNEYVKFLLTFCVDHITMTVDTTNSYYFQPGEQYVLRIR